VHRYGLPTITKKAPEPKPVAFKPVKSPVEGKEPKAEAKPKPEPKVDGPPETESSKQLAKLMQKKKELKEQKEKLKPQQVSRISLILARAPALLRG